MRGLVRLGWELGGGRWRGKEDVRDAASGECYRDIWTSGILLV